ncbi:hypothetical protein [Cellulomonas septica]|uniref:Uncharacterized protein n=1 Tax=Cellulomonas septica TaxID=285080 RepID=A0ABX1JVM0_9CELL|nr:hypothetical protein [Cellulomonas septica]NKY38335.1 hypothetical protein [Cellulomonas septica]
MDASYPPPSPSTSTTPRRSLVGPVVLTSAGALLLVGAIVAAVVVARTFLSLLPLGVIDAQGDAGPSAVAWTDVPGAVDVDLAPGRYDVFLVVDDVDAHTGLDADVRVVGPDGSPVEVDDAPGVSINAQRGDRRAFNVAAFTVTAAGEHTVVVPGSPSDGALAVVAEGQRTSSFLLGVFGTIGGVFLTIVLGLLGLGLTAGGVVWWALRARARTVGPTARVG